MSLGRRHLRLLSAGLTAALMAVLLPSVQARASVAPFREDPSATHASARVQAAAGKAATAAAGDKSLGRGPGGPAMGAQVHALWADETAASRDREFALLAAHGVSWVRIDVSWSMIQPDGPAKYSSWGVAEVNEAIEAARAHKLQVLVMFWLTPDWARSSKNPVAYPDSPSRYAAAIGWAASHWRGRVAAWEIWNEPNLAAFAEPVDPLRYTALVRAAYPAVKRADPKATVVAGSLMYIDTDWVQRMYAAGLGTNFDALSVHSYQGQSDTAPDAGPETRIQRMTHTAALIALMRSKGDAKKQIWFTEFGWSVHANPPATPVWERGVSAEKQAAYLIASERLVRARWPQVTHMFWYSGRDRPSGTLHSRNRGLMTWDFRPKPALLDLGCHVAGTGCR